ncbi:hypothetical protein Gpo141_00007915 [Globisporangium polare]
MRSRLVVAEQDKQKLFQIHHAALVKSPVEAAPVAPVAPIEAPQPTEALVETPVEAVAPANVSTNSPVPPSSTATAPVVSAETRERARQIAEALVLSDFLTPYKDDEKYLNAVTPDYYVRDSELLIPIAASVTEIKTASV